MNILSSFRSIIKFFQTCMRFFLMLNIKYILKNAGNKTYFFHYYGSQWVIMGNTLVIVILQNILFCIVQHKKKTYTGFKWHESD